jgi:predicted nucleic acid-binding Zn ribbon protein
MSTRECVVCGAEIVQSRLRGRPQILCSPDCVRLRMNERKRRERAAAREARSAQALAALTALVEERAQARALSILSSRDLLR